MNGARFPAITEAARIKEPRSGTTRRSRIFLRFGAHAVQLFTDSLMVQ